MRKLLLIINCYTCIQIFQLFQSLDEIMSCDDIEENPQTEDIDAMLTIWKPKMLSALTHKTNLNPFHQHFATEAESFTLLNSLYGDHPSHEIDFGIKETMAITRSTAYPILLKTIKPKEEISTTQWLFCYLFFSN